MVSDGHASPPGIPACVPRVRFIYSMPNVSRQFLHELRNHMAKQFLAAVEVPVQARRRHPNLASDPA
jgi:hypothetical protein